MKELHFSPKYFNKFILDDLENKLRIVIHEKPCLNISEEGYSLRITTRYENIKTIHRDIAIEHHLPPAKHDFPHLQIKFTSEKIGQFRIRIDIKDMEEYQKLILGFIFQIKKILEELEHIRVGITKEILVLELVNELSKENLFFQEKINEWFIKYLPEIYNNLTIENLNNLKTNPFLISFLGKENLKLIK